MTCQISDCSSIAMKAVLPNNIFHRTLGSVALLMDLPQAWLFWMLQMKKSEHELEKRWGLMETTHLILKFVIGQYYKLKCLMLNIHANDLTWQKKNCSRFADHLCDPFFTGKLKH